MIKIKNNYIQTFQGANFATCSWCGSQRPAPYPFVGWTRSVQPIFIYRWSKRPLDSGGGRCDHQFSFRNNASEQYQKLSTLFRNFPTLFRKHIFAGFSSYQKDNLISCAHFANLIFNVVWAGSQRPTPKPMGQNGPLIFYRNNTEKSRWYCSAYCSE